MWNEIINEITYEHGLAILRGKGRLAGEAVEEVWRRHYEKHRGILNMNAGQVINMSREA